MDFFVAVVSGRVHHDFTRTGQSIDSLTVIIAAVMRAVLTAQAQIYHTRLAQSAGSGKNVIDAVDDVRVLQGSFNDD